MSKIKAFLKLILNTLFPPVCASCKNEGDFLCMSCIQQFTKQKIHSEYRGLRQKEFQHLEGVIYALDYAKNPGIKAAVQQFKYRFTQELADYFAALIIEKIGELGMTKNRTIVLIPVPLHKKRLNYRGFNQAEVIARAIEKKSTFHVSIAPLLERVKHTSQQAKLDKEERHENLKDAFKISKSYCHPERVKRVERMNKKFVQEQKIYSSFGLAQDDNLYFIVDDVCTTGATLENCAEVLKKNGLSKVYGLVVARALKKEKS